MKLLGNEQILLRMEPLTLTTHRVRLDEKPNQISSIMLDEVTSCDMTHRSHPVWLILAAIVLLGSIVIDRSELMNLARSIGLVPDSPYVYTTLFMAVFVFIYFITRKGALVIHATRSAISVPNTSAKELEEFIDTLESAKNNLRVEQVIDARLKHLEEK